MDQVKALFDVIRARLSSFAGKDAVASKPISAGNRHVVVLSEVTMAFGGGGGAGKVGFPDKCASQGLGGGGGAGAKASPVAVLVVENGVVRVETLS